MPFEPPTDFVRAGIPYWLSDGDDDCNDADLCLLEAKSMPLRDAKTNCFIFEHYPEFRPNLSPDEVLQAGSFGGTYFRSIDSKTANQSYDVGVHKEFPQEWFRDMSPSDISKKITSTTYDKDINKYGVKSGNDLEFWEKKGWMRKQDPYGWFQWYCRFYLGRRTIDDERQVSRWIRAIGPKGRWRTFLVGQCVKANKTYDDITASPVTRQTLLHWAYEITQADYNALAPAIQNGKSVIYMGPVVAPSKVNKRKKPSSPKNSSAKDGSSNRRRSKSRKQK